MIKNKNIIVFYLQLNNIELLLIYNQCFYEKAYIKYKILYNIFI